MVLALVWLSIGRFTFWKFRKKSLAGFSSWLKRVVDLFVEFILKKFKWILNRLLINFVFKFWAFIRFVYLISMLTSLFKDYHLSLVHDVFLERCIPTHWTRRLGNQPKQDGRHCFRRFVLWICMDYDRYIGCLLRNRTLVQRIFPSNPCW